MKNLLLQSKVHKQLLDFITKPSHALIIIGPDGSGKRTVAMELAMELLELENEDLFVTYPYKFILEPKDGVLSIAAIRELQDMLRLKTIGNNPIRRVIIVESAHAMGIEAQNAFLKMLEEPPADTVIILCVVGSQSMLSTIYSRSQQISLQPVGQDEAIDRFSKLGYLQSNIKKAYHLSDGQIGLLVALLSEDQNHPLVSTINQAKDIFKASTFDRLTMIDGLSKQKEGLLLLLQSMRRVASAALLQASANDRLKEVKRWHKALVSVEKAHKASSMNANSKLLLTDLFLNV